MKYSIPVNQNEFLIKIGIVVLCAVMMANLLTWILQQCFKYIFKAYYGLFKTLLWIVFIPASCYLCYIFIWPLINTLDYIAILEKYMPWIQEYTRQIQSFWESLKFKQYIFQLVGL